MTHRYAASTLGLLILAAAFLSLRRRRHNPDQPVALPLFLVVLVVMQGLLGMWTVTLLLKPLIVTLHLLGGMTTLLLLWWLSLRLKWRPYAGTAAPAGQGLRLLAVLALVVVYCQIALGGWTSSNYAAIACGATFPSCNGQWWPPMDFKGGFTVWRGLGINYEYGVLDAPARAAIHMVHRLGALVTFIVVGTLALRCLSAAANGLKKAGLVLALALLVQVSLGIANVRLGLPLPVAVAHNAGAAVLLLSVATVLHLLAPARTRR
jgi:cytochrome c oxidase assembly protein subunit 15